MKQKILLSVILAILIYSGISAQSQDYPFRDTRLTFNERVKDLISRLTVEEKISLLTETFYGIPRLGIPKYFHGNEALHGVVRPGPATVFPQAIALAATWNTDLMLKAATVISDEARAKWNGFLQGKNQTAKYSDLLTFWSPDINLARDPRWGRTPETYGEDPYLSARMAVSFVKGLQGDDPKYLKVVSTPKHYTANNEEHNRFECNAEMSTRSLREYYLVPFECAVKEGKAASIMSAYNAVNGVPCTANKLLLTDILRNEWGFNGYVVSDCGAPGLIYSDHKYVASRDSAAAVIMNAGLDLECSGGCDKCFIYRDYLIKAFHKNMVTTAQIDSAASRVLYSRFRLGVFDKDNPYDKIPPSVNGSKEHQQLALETARESIVLLKNQNNILPLMKEKIKSIAIVGPHSADCEFGDYSGTPVNEKVSILDGIKRKTDGKVSINYVPWFDRDEGFVLITKDYLRAENGQPGLDAEYFGNKTLTGTPEKRIDELVNYDPANQPPDPVIPKSPMSIRWTGTLTPKISGVYKIALNSDDGIRLYIDGKKVIDSWVERGNTRDVIELKLTAGQNYKIAIEYFDQGGDAVALLKWLIPNTEKENQNKMELEAAAKSDYVIIAVGINKQVEAEGLDRKTMDLSPEQENLVEEVYKVNKNVIVVLVTGSPISINWITKNIPAVVNSWYSGEQGGNAVADVLFGDYNPAGRLPLTFYKSVDDLLPFDDYYIEKGRTYLYSTKKPLYPFGFGLSYTKFNYSGLKLSSKEMKADGLMKVMVTVKNTGSKDGDEVLQLYLKNLASGQKQPIKALKGFKRIALKKGEAKAVELTLKGEDLRYFDEQKNCFVVAPGKYEVMIGSSSENIKLKQNFDVK
jgi:beta-glucosidase